MTSEQVAQLLKLLEKTADRPFTITQATGTSIMLNGQFRSLTFDGNGFVKVV